MDEQPALFEVTPLRVEVVRLSPDRRRTQLAGERLAAGFHPLSGVAKHPIRLHPDAPPVDDREAPGPRCGTCWYRQRPPRYKGRVFPKCVFPEGAGPDEIECLGPPRASKSAASDCWAWWPACGDYSPGDGQVSRDAARSIPG